MAETQSRPAMLDRPLTDDDRREWTARVAAEVRRVEPETESVVIFRIGSDWLALSTAVFESVAEPGPVHALPRRRDRADIGAGLINFDGELVISVSLGALMGLSMESQPGRTPRRILVVNGGGGRLAFPVDEVQGVRRYRPDQLSSVPATLGNASRSLTAGILRWEGRSVARLDDRLLLAAISAALS